MSNHHLNRRFVITLLVVTRMSLFGQDASEDAITSQSAGFGLQSSIFGYVQNTSVDLSRNFSDAKNYLMTPGDTFTLTTSYGGVSRSQETQQTAASYELQLSEDYSLDVPILGVISVAGYDLLSLGEYVSSELKKVVPLQHAGLLLSQPAQFNVFVYGNVIRPGFLTANPMLRLIDAIALSGGFKSDGSYRAIRLERSNEEVILDISRFYSEARFESNPPLQPGDVIFVPTARRVVTIQGEMRYPGRYELAEDETLWDVLNLSGGFLPAAETKSVDLIRHNEENRLLTIRVDATEFEDFAMQSGDIVRVRSSADNLLRIAIEGAIWGRRISASEGINVPVVPIRVDLPYYDSMSLLDVLEEVGGPTPFAEADRSFVIRSETDQRVPVDIETLWEQREADGAVLLEPGDTIVVPMQTLDVFVTGMVAAPGRFSYISGYTAGDYILHAGGLDPRRASAQALYLVDERGRRNLVAIDDVVPRGSTIFVGRKLLFFVDDTVQNIFFAAAWVTTAISITNAIIDFVALLVS